MGGVYGTGTYMTFIQHHRCYHPSYFFSLQTQTHIFLKSFPQSHHRPPPTHRAALTDLEFWLLLNDFSHRFFCLQFLFIVQVDSTGFLSFFISHVKTVDWLIDWLIQSALAKVVNYYCTSARYVWITAYRFGHDSLLSVTWPWPWT